MKNKILTITLFLLTISLVSCLTFDIPIIYKKNYQCGFNSNLKFNGFYSDTIIRKIMFADGYYRVNPIFFYADGSVDIGSTFYDTSALRSTIQNKFKFGTWGNYKINGDTIKIETFWTNGGTMNKDRFQQIAIIKKDTIKFISEINRFGIQTPDTNGIAGNVFFNRLDIKPDSTLNWIRTKKKYNKK